jgi:tetratricopeptide (TPR) repeat protein
MTGARGMATLEGILRAGLAAQGSGQLEAAAASYLQALALMPRCADALHLLGQVRHQQDRNDEALDLVRRAIRAAPPTAMYFNTQGVVLRALERGREALIAFRRALSIDPRHAGARKNAAVELARADAPAAELVDAFMAAVALQNGDAECWLGLAQALLRAERAPEAIAAVERAHGLDPSAGTAIDTWYAAARDAKRLPEFVDRMAGLAGVSPLEEVALRRIDALLELDRHPEATTIARDLVADAPDHPVRLEKLAAAQQAGGDFATAAESFRHALVLAGDSSFARIGLAQCVAGLGRLAEALAMYDEILARHPESRQAFNNRGVTLGGLDRDREAIVDFDRAVALSPGDVTPRANRGMCLLRLGRLREAWDDYLWRESATGARPTERWPASLAGRRIHIRCEQGIGDHLFFLRFVPMIQARGADVTIDVDDRLAAMIERAGFVFAYPPPPGREIASLGNLPWLLGCGDADLPSPVSLPVLDDRAARVAYILRALPRPIICATWRAGGKKGRKDTVKSVPPEALGAALRDVPGTIVSVQRLAAEGEHAAFEAGLGRPAPDLGPINDDLETMLALMAELDAYAGVSSANVHLRYGAGRASDVLATFPIDWRWRVREDGATPWYPGSTAHHQGPGGDWSAALRSLTRTLRARFG